MAGAGVAIWRPRRVLEVHGPHPAGPSTWGVLRSGQTGPFGGGGGDTRVGHLGRWFGLCLQHLDAILQRRGRSVKYMKSASESMPAMP